MKAFKATFPRACELLALSDDDIEDLNDIQEREQVLAASKEGHMKTCLTQSFQDFSKEAQDAIWSYPDGMVLQGDLMPAATSMMSRSELDAANRYLVDIKLPLSNGNYAILKSRIDGYHGSDQTLLRSDRKEQQIKHEAKGTQIPVTQHDPSVNARNETPKANGASVIFSKNNNRHNPDIVEEPDEDDSDGDPSFEVRRDKKRKASGGLGAAARKRPSESTIAVRGEAKRARVKYSGKGPSKLRFLSNAAEQETMFNDQPAALQKPIHVDARFKEPRMKKSGHQESPSKVPVAVQIASEECRPPSPPNASYGTEPDLVPRLTDGVDKSDTSVGTKISAFEGNTELVTSGRGSIPKPAYTPPGKKWKFRAGGSGGGGGWHLIDVDADGIELPVCSFLFITTSVSD